MSDAITAAAQLTKMTRAADLEPVQYMAPSPIYPREMVRISRVSRTSHISVTVKLTDGTVQYLNPNCLLHTMVGQP